MENPSSPLETLRQLKEMLDAGALTPTEFEALKQRLVFNPNPLAPEVPPAKPTEMPMPAQPIAEKLVTAVAPSPELPAELTPPQHGWTEPVYVPAPDSLFLPETSPDFPMPALQVEHTDQETSTFIPEEPPVAAIPERNSSLGLVLAIGAVLVFLAVVAYLGFTRPATDEHISSISQTAADSLNTTIETGPQVAPLPAPTAAPETVRVAPTNPAPVIRPRPAAPVVDSVASAANSPVADSTDNH